MEKNYSHIIAIEHNLTRSQVSNTIKLLEDGATIPFIARYRKEMTGSLDENMILLIRERLKQLKELDKRRKTILDTIEEQGKLTDELKLQILEAGTINELEDIYLPYKPKRKTRASIAKSKGLEPLAKIILKQDNIDLGAVASNYVSEENEVLTGDDALSGARDIIAEWVNESKKARSVIRDLSLNSATISSKVGKGKEEEGEKYNDYFEYNESIKKAPSHRVLAVFRGENEGFLKVSVSPMESKAVAILEDIFVRNHNDCSEQVELAVIDSYKRLMAPSIENEIRLFIKEKADKDAIGVFSENLRQLLLASPLGQKNVLAIDPGFRSGCKIVCLDKQGNLMHNETIYPHPPQKDTKRAINKIESLVDAYDIEAIAVGNGTAGRETESLIRRIRFKKDVVAIMVNESGASVYSASPVAREEFPDYDVTVRGAVSIGRRLMDPLAELVKIDPKSIGVGQYQHDVDQSSLKKSLEDIVVSCVNAVGVEVNTASKQLLTYVSGLGPVLAQNLIDYRAENGNIMSRAELKKISRFGEKAFEQAAGFLRIRESENPLDQSAVHPESYSVVSKMSKDINCEVNDLIKDPSLRSKISVERYISDSIGLPTLVDIVSELKKPGRDPRKRFEMFEFDKDIHAIEDVIPGMILPGIVTNITAFGAFVDIGVHQDGLVHISQLADRFVKDPNEVVRMNQKVTVRVLDVDVNRKRIQLSMKNIAGETE